MANRLLRKSMPWSSWYDPAIIPLYVSLAAGVYVCGHYSVMQLTCHTDMTWDKKKNLDQKVYNSDTPYQTRADAFWFFSNRRDSNIGLFGGGEERAGVNEIMADKLNLQGGDTSGK